MSSLDPALKVLLDDSFTGSNVACILYGAYLIIALSNIYLLYNKGSRFLLAYTAVLVCITTVYMGVAVNYAQVLIVDDPTSPDLLSVWPQVVVDSAYTINNWLTDGYLIYRCYVIWCGAYHSLILLLPIAVYLGSMGCSIALLVFTANPGASYSTHIVQVFGTATWSLSLSLNVIVTLLISGRLIYYRTRSRKVLGTSHGRVYTTILAISVESAALYAIFELIVLATFLKNSATENVFFPMLGNVQVIAPNLIIFRIANGISFTSEITNPTDSTNIKFASRKPTMLPSRDESHTQVGTGYSQPSTSEKKRTISSSSQEESSLQMV